MALCIRLSRLGRTHRPFFRILAIDKRCHREGKANEILGTYDPLAKEKNIQVDLPKIEAWVKEGAQVSPALRSLLKHHGYVLASKPRVVGANRATNAELAAKAGKTWVKPTRRAVLQHRAKLKAARKTELEKTRAAKAEAKSAAAKPAESTAPA
jgi:small subunit ribosomal protein S16